MADAEAMKRYYFKPHVTRCREGYVIDLNFFDLYEQRDIAAEKLTASGRVVLDRGNPPWVVETPNRFWSLLGDTVDKRLARRLVGVERICRDLNSGKVDWRWLVKGAHDVL